MLESGSEAFVWVGKKVVEKDRLQIYQLALQHLALLHQQSKDLVERIALSTIDSGFEPDLFKSAFMGGWQNFESPITSLATPTSASKDEDSDGGEENKQQQLLKRKTTIAASEIKPKGNIKIIPENIWIN